jgi:hypothetical protein
MKPQFFFCRRAKGHVTSVQICRCFVMEYTRVPPYIKPEEPDEE